MKKYTKEFTYLFILWFISCGGMSDTIVNLGEGYYYFGEGKPNNYIFHGNENIDSIIILPCILDFDFDESHIIASQKPAEEEIKKIIDKKLKSLVLFYDIKDEPTQLSNSVFKDKKISIHEIEMIEKIKNQGYTGTNTSRDRRIIRYYTDSIYGIDNQLKRLFLNKKNFWIVDKQSRTLFGPLSSYEFKELKRKHNISEKLILEK